MYTHTHTYMSAKTATPLVSLECFDHYLCHKIS